MTRMIAINTGITEIKTGMIAIMTGMIEITKTTIGMIEKTEMIGKGEKLTEIMTKITGRLEWLK